MHLLEDVKRSPVLHAVQVALPNNEVNEHEVQPEVQSLQEFAE